MEFSSSIKHAQAIKLCELCDENKTLKWRCIDCDKCLCDKCKSIHLKVTDKHQIVSIATPLGDIERKIAIDDVACEDHLTKIICMYCKMCECPVCPECISSVHMKHYFIPLDTILEDKCRKLKDRQTNVAEQLKFYDEKSREIQNVSLQYESTFDESMTRIKQREQELKDSVSEYSKLLQEKVNVKRSQTKKTIAKVEQQVTKAKRIVEGQRNDIEQMLASNQGKDLLKATLSMEVTKIDSFALETEQFIPGTELKHRIPELFGSFQNTKLRRVQLAVHFEILKTFTPDLQYITRVVTFTNTSAWISSEKESILRKVKIEDHSLTTSSEISLCIKDIALTSEDDILVTEDGCTDIRILKRGKLNRLISFKGYFPLAVHVTKSRDIIVSVNEERNPLKPDQWTVRVFGDNYKEKHKFKFDGREHGVFKYPFSIKSNNNGNILIIDGQSMDTGRVVCLDEAGNLRWIYNGHSNANFCEPFEPRGVVTTSDGHIIVSDFNNHALRVLSEDGDLLTYKLMTDMGIQYPWALDMDQDGKLWICCGHNEIETEAKIHIVKFHF